MRNLMAGLVLTAAAIASAAFAQTPDAAGKPIKVEAGPWQALYLQHEAFSTTGLRKLSFLVQGSAPEGQPASLRCPTGSRSVRGTR